MTAQADGSAQLTYSLKTSPAPVEISTSTIAPSFTTLMFVVSCPRNLNSVSVAQIEIDLPVGTFESPDPSDLTETNPTQSAASISSTGSDQWNGPRVGRKHGSVSFIFTPTAPVEIASQSLIITLSGIQVSTLVGTAVIAISEWAAPNKGTPPPVTSGASGTLTMPVAKFPVGFYAQDFKADSPQIGRGKTATLSWFGSPNAKFTMLYQNIQEPVSDRRTWTSPPLYVTTVFVLHAETTQEQQTVSLDLPLTVEVGSPTVISFDAAPGQVDYNQPVTLSWRTINADGAYLIAGKTGHKELAPVSDDQKPETLIPDYDTTYYLRAFKRRAGEEEKSDLYPLDVEFFPLEYRSFIADRVVIDPEHPSVLISWDVAHAKSVTYQGAPVSGKDSRLETPIRNTTYELVIEAADSQVTKHTISVVAHKLEQITFFPGPPPPGGWSFPPDLTIYLVVDAGNLHITAVTLTVGTEKYQLVNAQVFSHDQNQWQVPCYFRNDAPRDAPPPVIWYDTPNVSVVCDIEVDDWQLAGVQVPKQG